MGLKRLAAILVVVGIVIVGQLGMWYYLAQHGESLEAVGANGIDYPNCRLGVGVIRNSISTYSGLANFVSMRMGWYVNWSAPLSPIKPAGMDFYHTIRLKQNKSGSTYLPSYVITPTLDLTPGGLGTIVQANPGSTWIIGNEPDRVYYQDETLPDMYATIYRDAYTFIKGIDPTAKVAIGGVIQPTPLRLQYLDAILTAYRSKYSSSMPIDVWNIHMYILREVAGSWGASIPPGINASTGKLYTIPQHVDINVFTSLVHDMRTWMQSRGYQDTPLIVTEYGVLFPEDVLAGFGLSRAQLDAFVSNATTYMANTTDTSIGYPADNFRLVQQAALYSLDDDGTDGSGAFLWGGFLFRSTLPYTLTAAGLSFQSLAQGITANVDLLPHRASTDPSIPFTTPGVPVTVTFKTQVSNSGNSTLPISATVRFFDVTGGGSTQVGSDVSIAPFTGCGSLREASVVWPNLMPGWHMMRIEVDPGNQITETLESNNVMTVTLLIPTYGVYLPTVQR